MVTRFCLLFLIVLQFNFSSLSSSIQYKMKSATSIQFQHCVDFQPIDATSKRFNLVTSLASVQLFCVWHPYQGVPFLQKVQKFLVSAHFPITLVIIRHHVKNQVLGISIKVASKAKHFTKGSAQKYKGKYGNLVFCILCCKFYRND